MVNLGVHLPIGHQRSQVWPILARFVGYYSLFGVPGWFQRLTNPRGLLRVVHQHSRFLSILTLFEDYYSPFWGPKAISIVVEPQGALTCRSSTIAVLADYGRFPGLLPSFGVPE